MLTITENNATDLFDTVLDKLRTEGVRRDRRGGGVVEFPYPVMLCLRDPTRYVCHHWLRRLNPWTMLAEFPWLMAGRSDVRWLLPYLPRAAQFADDGMRWRAGYGPRLRNNPLDQVGRVITQLRHDPSSRQAIISLWDAEADAVDGSKDYPCTQTLHFQQNADGKLDLVVHIRSNDVVWGMSGVNIPNFCLLLQYVAERLAMPLGKYYHLADNLHIYDRHSHMIGASYGAGPQELPSWYLHEPHRFPDTTDFSEAMATVEHLQQREGIAWTREGVAASISNSEQVGSYAAQWVHFMLLWQLANDTPHRRSLERKGDSTLLQALSGHLRDVGHRPWRLAAAMWMARAQQPDVVRAGRTEMRELLTPGVAAEYLEVMDADTA